MQLGRRTRCCGDFIGVVTKHKAVPFNFVLVLRMLRCEVVQQVRHAVHENMDGIRGQSKRARQDSHDELKEKVNKVKHNQLPELSFRRLPRRQRHEDVVVHVGLGGMRCGTGVGRFAAVYERSPLIGGFRPAAVSNKARPRINLAASMAALRE